MSLLDWIGWTITGLLMVAAAAMWIGFVAVVVQTEWLKAQDRKRDREFWKRVQEECSDEQIERLMSFEKMCHDIDRKSRWFP